MKTCFTWVLLLVFLLQSYSQQKYPAFSWKTVSLYLFVRKSGSYNKEELQYISKFPIVTFGQTTGADEYGSTEKGILAAAKAFKAINPNTKTIYYRNTVVHYPYNEADSLLNTINNPFLKDASGKTDLHLGKRPYYDLSNQDVRKWWIDNVVHMSNYDAIDGVFFDGVGKIVTNYLVKDVGKEKQQAVLEGYNRMIADCQQKMNPAKLKIANVVRANFPNQGLDYLQAFDGSYLEHFDRDTEWTAIAIKASQSAARAGKILCMTFDIGDVLVTNQKLSTKDGYLMPSEALQKRFEYCLALYLICAEKYSYFCFYKEYSVNEWSKNPLWMKWFAEYDKPLGKPKTTAVQSGHVYTREFQHASVWVDIKKATAKITWNK